MLFYRVQYSTAYMALHGARQGKRRYQRNVGSSMFFRSSWLDKFVRLGLAMHPIGHRSLGGTLYRLFFFRGRLGASCAPRTWADFVHCRSTAVRQSYHFTVCLRRRLALFFRVLAERREQRLQLAVILMTQYRASHMKLSF